MFTIRTPEDANRVVRLARGRNAVVVGAGFLGERPGLVGVMVCDGWAVLAPGGAGCQPAVHHPGPRDGGGCLSDRKGPLSVRGGAGGDALQEIFGGTCRSCPHEGEPTPAPSTQPLGTPGTQPNPWPRSHAWTSCPPALPDV